MAQFAQSSSIHAASKHYAVDRKRICEWIQNLKAAKFNGVSSRYIVLTVNPLLHIHCIT